MNEKLNRAARDRRALDADRVRLQRMFAVYHGAVWRTLRRHGLSPDEAADAAQKAFLHVAERLADVAPDNERAFLIGAAFRVARGLRRKTSELEAEHELGERALRSGDDRVAVDLCDLALAEVSCELTDVFVLYEIEGFSPTEIATLLDLQLATVISCLCRAREQFRAGVARLERALVRGQAS